MYVCICAYTYYTLASRLQPKKNDHEKNDFVAGFIGKIDCIIQFVSFLENLLVCDRTTFGLRFTELVS